MAQASSHNWFRRLFVDNFGLKLFSLFIALISWLYVQGAGEQSVTIDVPLSVDIAEDKVLVSDVPSTVKLTVTGTWAAVKSWDHARLRVNLDMRQSQPGPSVQYLEEDVFNLPPGIRIARISPSKLTLNFAIKGKKLVSVIPQVKGKPVAGYIVKGFVVKPENIEVSGAEGDLLYLTEVLTEEIDVQDKNQNFTASVNPLRLSKNIEFPKKAPIEVTVKIEKDVIEREFKGIPIQVVNITHEFALTPKTVDIKLVGPRNLVEKFDASLLRAEVVGTEGEGDEPGEYKREIHFKDLPKAILDEVKQIPSVYLAKLTIKAKRLPVPEETPQGEQGTEQGKKTKP